MLSNLKNILVGITHESYEDADLSAMPYALCLAQAADAHLTVQAAAVRVMVTNAFVADFTAEIVAHENRRLLALADAAAEHSRQNAQTAGITCSVETSALSYPDLIDAFTTQARVHDLAVIDAEPEALSVDRGLIEAVLLGSGRPLIVVPRGAQTFRADRILVAWDGSARAARAINDALPFLKMAKAVEVVSVEGAEALASTVRGADLARHLARHGIEVVVTTLPEEGPSVADTLRRRAIEGQADMIVMGAFVHSHLRELVFGGVTQSLLGASPVALFMAH